MLATLQQSVRHGCVCSGNMPDKPRRHNAVARDATTLAPLCTPRHRGRRACVRWPKGEPGATNDYTRKFRVFSGSAFRDDADAPDPCSVGKCPCFRTAAQRVSLQDHAVPRCGARLPERRRAGPGAKRQSSPPPLAGPMQPSLCHVSREGRSAAAEALPRRGTIGRPDRWTALCVPMGHATHNAKPTETVQHDALAAPAKMQARQASPCASPLPSRSKSRPHGRTTDSTAAAPDPDGRPG